MTDNKKLKYGAEEIQKYADPKHWEIWDAPKGFEALYQVFPEFTCLCPRSGYPDFAKVHLVTVPNKKVIEMKNLKMWLNSFRNVGISHEDATYQILETLVKKLDLHYGFILMEYTPRGNLTTFPMREFLSNSNEIYDKKDGLDLAIENAQDLKMTVMHSVMMNQLDK